MYSALPGNELGLLESYSEEPTTRSLKYIRNRYPKTLPRIGPTSLRNNNVLSKLEKDINRTIISPIVYRCYTLTKSHHPFSSLPPNKCRRYTNPVFFNLVTPSRITTTGIFLSKISYSLIEPQLFFCISTCGYKFHGLAVYLHPTFTAPPIAAAFGI